MSNKTNQRKSGLFKVYPNPRLFLWTTIQNLSFYLSCASMQRCAFLLKSIIGCYCSLIWQSGSMAKTFMPCFFLISSLDTFQTSYRHPTDRWGHSLWQKLGEGSGYGGSALGCGGSAKFLQKQSQLLLRPTKVELGLLVRRGV